MTARFIPLQPTLYPVIVAFFVAVFLISNILATKGVAIGPLITDGAFFLFPLAYVLGDVIAECYGFKAARRAIFTGFGVTLLAVASFYVAIWLPPADFYESQSEFAHILGLVPQIVVASLAGYIVGQLLNSWVLVKIKQPARSPCGPASSAPPSSANSVTPCCSASSPPRSSASRRVGS